WAADYWRGGQAFKMSLSTIRGSERARLRLGDRSITSAARFTWGGARLAMLAWGGGERGKPATPPGLKAARVRPPEGLLRLSLNCWPKPGGLRCRLWNPSRGVELRH